MKNKRHWFVGLALALPVAVLIVVLSSFQASAKPMQAAEPHMFYGGVYELDGVTGYPAPAVIEARDDAESRIWTGIKGNPITTTEDGLYGGPGIVDEKLEVQGDGYEMYNGMPITFYVSGMPAKVRECGTTGGWLDTYPFNSGDQTCLDLQAAPSVAYTLTVTAGECCTVTVDGVPITPTFTASFPDIGSAVLEAITGTCCNFVQWTVDGTDIITANPTTIVLTEDLAVEAICYVPTFTLTTHSDPPEGGDVLKNPDLPSYTCGEPVTVTVDPEVGWFFDHWSGDLTGTNDSGVIAMDTSKEVTATFVEATHFLTVTSDGCRPISVTYDATVVVVAAGLTETYVISHSHAVTLEAVYSECCVFDGWELDDVPWTGNPINVIMDADHTAVALSHGPPFPLVVGRDPEVGGAVAREPDKPGGYDCNDVVTITATANVTDHWEFAGWIGDLVSDNPTEVITMTGDKVVTATFALETFIVTFPPVEGGEVVPDPEQPPEGYEYGQVVTLTAVPTTCYKFVEWTGLPDGVPTDTETVVITVTEEMTITAIFQLQTHTLDIVVDPLGKGQVTVDPDLSVYTCCTYITLTAVPTDNWQFVGWSGGATGTATETVIHMGEEDLVVTATFALETFTLTYDPDPEGGTVGVEEEDPDGEYEYGETITITADEAYCYEFVGWTGDLEGYPNPAVITVTKDLAFEATFQRQEHSLTVNVAPPGGGTVDPPSGTYTCCTWVTVIATPTTGYTFTGWLGDIGAVPSMTNPIDIHIGEEDLVVTATFYSDIQTYTLTVAKAGDGNGTVDPDVGTHSYLSGTVVSMTADPDDPASYFAGWSGALIGTDLTGNITMDSDKEVTATFMLSVTEHILTVESVGCCSILVEYDTFSDTVTADDTELFTITAGIGVTLTATPGELCGFDGWQVDGGSVTMDNSITVTMDDKHTAIATCTRHFIFLPVVARNYSP